MAGCWMLALKYTSLPSGLKASGVSRAELVVRRRALPPLAGTTKMSKLPCRSLWKAM